MATTAATQPVPGRVRNGLRRDARLPADLGYPEAPGPDPGRRLGVACGFGARQVLHYARYAQRLTQPIDITSTIEYQMAKWFDANLHDQRVFAPGNVSLWMNMFTDVPQVAGCCDQGIPNQEYRIAVYTIYTGQNAGARDAEISLLWLRAYGANAIGTTGPNSTGILQAVLELEEIRRRSSGVVAARRKCCLSSAAQVRRSGSRDPQVCHHPPRSGERTGHRADSAFRQAL